MEYTIEAFADQLLNDKGITDVDEETRTQLRVDLIERIEDFVNTTLLSHIKEEDLETFEKELDQGSEEAIQAFLRSHIPDLESVTASTLAEFRTIYLGNHA